jgi:hypothetical protein
MRIAFDLDGVLADLHTPFVNTAVRLFPNLDPRALEGEDTSSPPADADALPDEDAPQATPAPDLTRRQTDAVWRELTRTTDFWETLEEFEPGAIAKLGTLADERGWEVIFITSRPHSKGRTVQRQTQRWLASKGFPMPSVYVIHGSRGRVAEALAIDLVVDDRPDNCLDIVLGSKAGAILLWRGAPNTAPASTKRLGIVVAHTVDRVLDAIVEAERAADGVGVIDRLKRLFGLKGSAGSAGGR